MHWWAFIGYQEHKSILLQLLADSWHMLVLSLQLRHKQLQRSMKRGMFGISHKAMDIKVSTLRSTEGPLRIVKGIISTVSLFLFSNNVATYCKNFSYFGG